MSSPTEQGATEQAAPAAPQPSHAYPSSTYPAGGDARRSTYASAVDMTVGCPTGELVFDQSSTTIRVTESCRKITIAADFVTVLAEHVDSVIVLATYGSGVVLVRSANSVVISGNSEDVYWDESAPKTVRITGDFSTANPNPAPEP
jgi:hypothetical protein